MARSRFRSVTYDLESCVALARAVADRGGGVDAGELAVALGYSGERNGAFLTRLANTRLFGLVAGRSGRVVLTERGAAAASGSPEERGLARRDAVRSVPLFAALLEARRGRPLGAVDDLVASLVGDFGEQPAKARLVAAKFVQSVGQAGMLAPSAPSNRSHQGITNFTAHSLRSSLLFLPGVRSRRAAGMRPVEAATGRRGGPFGGRDGVVDGTDGGPTRDVPEPVAGPPDPSTLWLDEPDTAGGKPRVHRRLAVGTAAAVCVALIGVPVGLVLASGGKTPPVALPPVPRHPVAGAAEIAGGPATHEVLSALSATTDSGSFNFSYDLSATAATSPTTTSTTSCHLVYPVYPAAPVRGGVAGGGVAGTGAATMPLTPMSGTNAGGSFSGSTSSGSSGTGSSSTGSAYDSTLTTMPPVEACTPQAVTQPVGTVVSGQGTIDTNPMGMVATARVGQNGGLDVSVRVDGTDYWELSGNDGGLAPTGSDANAAPSGSPLHSFASLVESTLGTRAGAVAMTGMASPTGYLDLASSAVSGAQQVGTTSVGGVTLTEYQVSIDPSQLASAPGITPEEATTIDDALVVLHQQGLTGISDTVSIDPTGFIRHSTSVASFADGATVSLAAQFSNFGCAGTVLMPGQQGPSSPPANCTSPDTGLPTTTTTTTSSSTTSTTGATPTTIGSGGSGGSTTTTLPPTTTTTLPTSTTSTTSAPGSTTTGAPHGVRAGTTPTAQSGGGSGGSAGG